jgi:hypothetical protein
VRQVSKKKASVLVVTRRGWGRRPQTIHFFLGNVARLLAIDKESDWALDTVHAVNREFIILNYRVLSVCSPLRDKLLEPEVERNLLEVGALYHSLLFSYQRGLRKYMGSKSNAYIHPAISHLLEMDEEGGLRLDSSKTFEEALAAFTDFLVRTKMTKNCTLDKIGEDNYVFRVNGCIWSAKVHTRQVSLKDVTCPYALVAMALYKKYKGFVPSENESEYFNNGTETILEPASY